MADFLFSRILKRINHHSLPPFAWLFSSVCSLVGNRKGCGDACSCPSNALPLCTPAWGIWVRRGFAWPWLCPPMDSRTMSGERRNCLICGRGRNNRALDRKSSFYAGRWSWKEMNGRERWYVSWGSFVELGRRFLGASLDPSIRMLRVSLNCGNWVETA